MKLRYLNDVVTLTQDIDKCIGCGRCCEVCPHAVWQMSGRKSILVDRDACMECGACAKNCPVDVISMTSGVGCARAIITGYFRGTEANCDCCCD
ncbi:MAG: mercury methylation ferredoxin HgcB [Thermoguttaceae bacterium]